MPPRAPVLRRLLRPGRSRCRGPSGWRRRRSLLAVGQCSWSSVILCGGRNSCGLCHHERDRSPPRPAHAPARIASLIEINRGRARITGRNVLGRTFLGRSFAAAVFLLLALRRSAGYERLGAEPDYAHASSRDQAGSLRASPHWPRTRVGTGASHQGTGFRRVLPHRNA